VTCRLLIGILHVHAGRGEKPSERCLIAAPCSAYCKPGSQLGENDKWDDQSVGRANEPYRSGFTTGRSTVRIRIERKPSLPKVRVDGPLVRERSIHGGIFDPRSEKEIDVVVFARLAVHPSTTRERLHGNFVQALVLTTCAAP
jgi:hypothetical protein